MLLQHFFLDAPYLHPASATGVIVLASCVCVWVWVWVFLALTAERTDVQTWILACRSSGRASRSSSKVKVIGQRSRSPGQKNVFSMRWHMEVTDADETCPKPASAAGSGTNGSSDHASRITPYLDQWDEEWSSQQDHSLSGTRGQRVILTETSTLRLLYLKYDSYFCLVRNNDIFDTIYEWYGYDVGCFQSICGFF